MWRRKRRQSIAAPSSVVRRGGGVARGWEGASITIQTSSVVSRGGERMRDTQHGGGRERAHLGRTEWVIPITRSLFLPAFWWRLRRSKKTNFHPEDPFAQAALTRPAEESGGTCLLAYVREGREGGKGSGGGGERKGARGENGGRGRRSYRLPIMTGGKRGKGGRRVQSSLALFRSPFPISASARLLLLCRGVSSPSLGAGNAGHTCRLENLSDGEISGIEEEMGITIPRQAGRQSARGRADGTTFLAFFCDREKGSPLM